MKRIFPLIIIILIVISLWLGSLLIITSVIDTWEHRGQFGDLFGSVNALFSGLAFAGLIYTIFLQRTELQLQRNELKLQREEMTKSREELAEQAHIQRAQFKASIAQLSIAANQAEVEASKMEAAAFVPGAQKRQIEAIREISVKLNNRVNELNKLLD